MKIIHEILESGPLQVNCQLLGNPERKEALLIDPGGDADQLLDRLSRHGLELVAILATHGHFDHLGAVAELQQATRCPFHLHPADHSLAAGAARHAEMWGVPFGAAPTVDADLGHDQQLTLAGISLQVIHTPGHTQGGVCFRFGDHLIVGDTLFQGSIGRTDLPGGDYDQLITMVKKRLFTLPDAVRCYPGHGPITSISQEKTSNPFFS